MVNTMIRVYVKEEICIGCHLCEVYCQLQHAQSKDIIKALKRGAQHPLSRLRIEESGIVSFSVFCQQCDESPCFYACLTGAITRDETTGMIELDEQKCIGCWTCIMVCPFGAIRRDIKQGKAIKCDLCEGETVPACVANCPNEALAYMALEDESSNRESKVVTAIQSIKKD